MDDLVQSTQDIYYDRFRPTFKEDPQTKSSKPTAAQTSSKQALEAIEKKFKEDEDALRKRFMEQIKQEELRFKSWEQRVRSTSN